MRAKMQSVAERATRGLGPDTITRRVLDNGMTVLVYPNPTVPSLVARVSLKGGAMFDPPDKAGLASFAVRSLRRGTERHTFEQLNEETESRGASVGVDAGQTLIEAGGRALKEDTGFLLETLAEVLLQPSFPETEIEKLRLQLRTGLVEMETDTGSVSELAFRQALYPESHPFHYRVAGFLSTLDNIRRDDMLAFYRRYFRPDRALMVVVGDVEPEDIVSRAQDLFGGWRAEGEVEPYTIPDVEQPLGEHRVFKFVPGKTQNDIVLGFPSMRRADPDYYAFDLMNLLLGRIGLMGRLGKNVRDDQGLAYHAGSSFEAGLGAGPWAVRAGVNPSSVLRAIESIRHEIERIRTEPISEAELEGGKRYMTGVMPLRLETSNGLLGALSEIELFGLGYDYISRYSDIIWALTPEIVGEVAKRRLSSQDYVVSVAGPPVEGLVTE